MILYKLLLLSSPLLSSRLDFKVGHSPAHLSRSFIDERQKWGLVHSKITCSDLIHFVINLTWPGLNNTYIGTMVKSHKFTYLGVSSKHCNWSFKTKIRSSEWVPNLSFLELKLYPTTTYLGSFHTDYIIYKIYIKIPPSPKIKEENAIQGKTRESFRIGKNIPFLDLES
jgi:hypothetical protein